MKNKNIIIAIFVIVAIMICAGIVIIGTSGKNFTSGNPSQSETDHSQGVDDTNVDDNKENQNNNSNNSEEKDTSSGDSEGGLNVEQNGNGESVNADDLFGDKNDTSSDSTSDNEDHSSSDDKNDTTVDTEKDTTVDSEEDTTSESEEGLPEGEIDTEQGWGPLL